MAQPTGEGRRELPPRDVLRHPLRVRIVAACSQREVTPREIADLEKIHPKTTRNHFRVLENAGYLRRVREETVRGVRRVFYRADRLAVITDDEFGRMTTGQQHHLSEAVIRDFFARCWESLEAGTLDARDDSHLTWIPFQLDEPGWRDLMSELAQMLDRSTEIQAESSARLRKSGEQPIPTTFALAGFESPRLG
ncbi:MAG TPA: winged helix-turn-helix domain-containing protein [Solirubrobacterales bacterium]|nr:winged helix-turn-helix domain-containing protein [Solirubrobacterales bacterium]